MKLSHVYGTLLCYLIQRWVICNFNQNKAFTDKLQWVLCDHAEDLMECENYHVFAMRYSIGWCELK